MKVLSEEELRKHRARDAEGRKIRPERKEPPVIVQPVRDTETALNIEKLSALAEKTAALAEKIMSVNTLVLNKVSVQPKKKQWVFKVVRDKNGVITAIRADED